MKLKEEIAVKLAEVGQAQDQVRDNWSRSADEIELERLRELADLLRDYRDL